MTSLKIRTKKEKNIAEKRKKKRSFKFIPIKMWSGVMSDQPYDLNSFL
jgi:hypothetical protein